MDDVTQQMCNASCASVGAENPVAALVAQQIMDTPSLGISHGADVGPHSAAVIAGRGQGGSRGLC